MSPPVAVKGQLRSGFRRSLLGSRVPAPVSATIKPTASAYHQLRRAEDFEDLLYSDRPVLQDRQLCQAVLTLWLAYLVYASQVCPFPGHVGVDATCCE